MKRFLCMALSIFLVFGLFSGCFGGATHSGVIELDPSTHKNGGSTQQDGATGTGTSLHRAEVLLPAPAASRACLDDAQTLAVGAYLVARMNLEKLLQYDVETGNQAEYDQLLADTLAAFETADAMAGALSLAADASELLEKAGGAAYSGAAAYQSLAAHARQSGLMPMAYAAEDPPALKWAKQITEIYDNAPPMKGVRTLAEQLGTDAKHAYAQLKQAQAILEGAAYDDFADYANECYKTAVVLKTAGTAAGFAVSIAVAGPATGLAAVAQTGGIVMSGVNTVLEVGSAGTIISTNGEGNEYTAAFEKTEAQMAPIGHAFSVLSIGLNAHKLLTGGYSADAAKATADGTYRSYLDGVKNDGFGAVSYLGTSVYDFMDSGSILGGTFTRTDSGTKFTLVDTMCGDNQAAKENIKDLFRTVGFAQDLLTDTMLFGPLSALPALNEVPLSQANAVIAAYPGVAPGSSFDAGAYKSALVESYADATQQQLKKAAKDAGVETGKDAEDAKEKGSSSIHAETETGTFDFYDGTGVLFDSAADTKLMWTIGEDGAPIFISADDCDYTVDEDGNILRDGKQLLFDGRPINAKSGLSAEPPEEPTDLAALLNGNWLHTNSFGSTVKTFTVSGDTLIIEWQGTVFGQDGISTLRSTNSFVFDEATMVLTLKELSCSDPWQATTAEYFTFTLDGDTITSYYYHYISSLDDDGNYVYADGPGGTYTRIVD